MPEPGCCANPEECLIPTAPATEGEILPTAGEARKTTDATNGVGSKSICCESEAAEGPDVEKKPPKSASCPKCKEGCQCGASCCCILPEDDDVLKDAGYVPLPSNTDEPINTSPKSSTAKKEE